MKQSYSIPESRTETVRVRLQENTRIHKSTPLFLCLQVCRPKQRPLSSSTQAKLGSQARVCLQRPGSRFSCTGLQMRVSAGAGQQSVINRRGLKLGLLRDLQAGVTASKRAKMRVCLQHIKAYFF